MKTHTWLWWGVALLLICGCGRKPAPQAAAAPPRRAATHLQRERMPRPPIEPETVVTATPSQRLVLVHVTARGVPAPGVAVTLEAWREYAAFLHTASDSKGIARLLLPPRAQTLRIIAVHPRYAMVACQTNLAAGTAPLELALNLDQPGVVITAELRGPGADAVTQCFARIMPASWHGWNAVGGALASNCLDRHIPFPAIAAGLSNLRVSV